MREEETRGQEETRGERRREEEKAYKRRRDERGGNERTRGEERGGEKRRKQTRGGRRPHPLPLLQADLLQRPHQAGGSVRGPELGGRLQLPQLQVEGVGMVPRVLAAERDERLTFPRCDHRGCLFKHDVRHEAQISALFLGGDETSLNRFYQSLKPLREEYNHSVKRMGVHEHQGDRRGDKRRGGTMR